MKTFVAALAVCAFSSVLLESAGAAPQKRALISSGLEELSSIVTKVEEQIEKALDSLNNVTLTVEDSMRSNTQSLIASTVQAILEEAENITGIPQGEFSNCSAAQDFVENEANRIASLGINCTNVALSVIAHLQDEFRALLEDIQGQFQKASDAASECTSDFDIICNTLKLAPVVAAIIPEALEDSTQVANLVSTAVIEGNIVSVLAKGTSCLAGSTVSIAAEALKLASVVETCVATTTEEPTTTVASS